MTRRLALALAIVALGLSPAAAQLAPPPATQASIPIVGTITSASVLITGIPGQRTYVTSLLLIPAPTSVVTLSQGTGATCSGGTASNLTGALTFASGQVLNMGSGYGAIFVAALGNNICITISGAAAPGSISFSQF